MAVRGVDVSLHTLCTAPSLRAVCRGCGSRTPNRGVEGGLRLAQDSVQPGSSETQQTRRMVEVEVGIRGGQPGHTQLMFE